MFAKFPRGEQNHSQLSVYIVSQNKKKCYVKPNLSPLCLRLENHLICFRIIDMYVHIVAKITV